MIEFAIVGLGAWGLCVLERTVVRARHSSAPIRVHLVEPGQLGGGVYSASQPDYLVLNNACGQLSLYASPNSEEHPPYAVGLYEWAVVRGFRWVGHECRIGTEGEPIRPTDYLPRRLMGEYLAWFYDTLVADAPDNLEIVRHYAAAVDISPEIGGREAVVLDSGTTLSVDHVVLTSGHTFNAEQPGRSGAVRYLRPYPVEYFDEPIPPGAPVAVAGMGLVGFDVLTALTVGRGGTYEPMGSRKRYVPSGREPVIHLYSRSGVPYCAKSAHGVDPYGAYQPVVCTPEEFAELTHPGGSPIRRQVDFRNELLPLLFAEMQARYYTHAAYLKGGVEESSTARALLRSAWLDGDFENAVQKLGLLYGPLRSHHPDLRRCRPPLRLGPRLPGPGLRNDRDRPGRGAGRRGQPGQGGPGGAQDPPRPVALGHRVRRAVPRVLHRLPVECAGTDQPARGRSPAAAVPAAPRPPRRRRGPDRTGAGPRGHRAGRRLR